VTIPSVALSDFDRAVLGHSKPSRSERRGHSWSDRLGRLPEIVFGMALGTLLVAVAFAGARSSAPWAGHVYWLGQVAIFAVPTAFLLFRRRSILKIEAVGIALLMPITSYLVLLYYSPTRFVFLDEFGHLQTAQSILATHHLFHANSALAPSPQYPALEIVTTAISSMAHLSITASGYIVAGTAHVLTGLCLYFLIFEVWRNYRIAALSAVIYAGSPHYQFFDSYFIYETIALPFLLLTMLAVVKMLREQGRTANCWAIVAVLCGAVTAVSHHVTSYLLVALLIAFSIAQIFVPRSKRNWRIPGILLVVFGVIAVWDLKVATNTIAYFKPEVLAVWHSLVPSHSHEASSNGTSLAVQTVKRGISGQPPQIDTIMQVVSLLLLVVFTSIGIRRIWLVRKGDTGGAALGFAIGSLGLALAIGMHAFAPDLAARALPFFMIPACFVCALGINHIRTWISSHKHSRLRVLLKRTPILGTAVIVLIAIGGICGGYPNFYSRLPGPFLMSAFERSVDDHNLDVSAWMAATLTPNNGIASDFYTAQEVAALGHQLNKKGDADVFLTLHYTAADRGLIRQYKVSYLVIDKRMTELLPTSNFYFARDPAAGFYRAPLPRAVINKFNYVPGVSLIFNDGTISVYALDGTKT